MSRVRKIAIAGGTFSVALGVGFVMQNGDVLAARFGDPRPQSAAPAAPEPGVSAAAGTAVAVEAAVAALPQPAAIPHETEGPALVLPEEIVPPAMAGDAIADKTQSAVAGPAPSVAGATGLDSLGPYWGMLAQILMPADAPGGTAPMIGALAENLMPEGDMHHGPELAAGLADIIAANTVDESTPEMTPVSLESGSALIPSTAEIVADAILAALTPDVIAPPDPTTAAPAIEPDCTVSVEAATLPAGLVNLSVTAPCAGLAQVTFHHQGMMFSGLTDDQGKVLVTVPALSEHAVFIVDVGEGGGAVAMAEVPEMADLDRAVLQWQGAQGLSIHALEFGADYGSEGHVWSGAPRDARAAVEARGGFLMELGDPAATEPLFAQVYTFPSGTTARTGDVVLTVEAEVTADTCGNDISAQSIQVIPGADPEARDLTMAMPGCDATGDLLVVTGMLQDLHLAAR